eukprot:jgi/Tetstr1/444416/TSEL_032304.t2
MYSPSPPPGGPVGDRPVPLLVLPPGAVAPPAHAPHAAPTPASSGHHLSPSCSPAGVVRRAPHPAEGVVASLITRLDRLFSHLHPVLRASGLAVLLLAPADEERARGWFRGVPPPPAGPGKAPAGRDLWEAVLHSSERSAFLQLEQEGSLAIACVEAGLRALLDSYLLGNELPPAPVVLHVSWHDSAHPGTTGKWKHPAVQVDFLHTVRELLQLPVRGVRLLPPRPLLMHEAPRPAPSWQGPTGRVRPLPDNIAPAAVAVEAVIDRAGKDMQQLMAPKADIETSPGADFGIWPWRTIQRTLYRQVWICNRAKEALWLLDIRILQPEMQAFSLDDDHGLVAQGFELPSTLGSYCGDAAGSSGDGQALSLNKRVCLEHGESYCVTVKLSAQGLRTGIIAAAVVFTLVRDKDDGAQQPQEAFCTGARACVTVVPSKIIGKLRPEVLFDSPAELYNLHLQQLHHLLSASGQDGKTLLSWDDLPQYVAGQQASGSWGQRLTGFTFWRHVEGELQRKVKAKQSFPDLLEHTPSPGDAFASLIRLARALEVEELTMESDIRKYDMFSVRPALGYHRAGDRKYEVVFPSNAAFSGNASGNWFGLSTSAPPIISRNAPRQRFLVIEVKGLPEGRPYLDRGDTVFLRTCQPSNFPREFACLVLATDSTRVAILPPESWWELLPQHSSLHPDLFPAVHVRLSFDRVLLRRMGMALLRAADSHLVLMPPAASEEALMTFNRGTLQWPSSPTDPAAASVDTKSGSDSLSFRQALAKGKESASEQRAAPERVNPAINEEQWAAVTSVLSGRGRPQPYILFGPAGTGKTLTLTELILQILKTRAQPQTNGQVLEFGSIRPPVLACAPTAFAADILCGALAAAGVGKGAMVRLNDIRRSPATVKQDVLGFCMTRPQPVMQGRNNAERPSFCIDMNALRQAQVVVASCSAAAILEPLAREVSGYDYIIMDEAAQALVPEALIPLSLASRQATVVLGGDPRQLGPTVRCRYTAASRILQHSLQLEWLLWNGSSPATICMLRRNYRSSAALLQLPSQMFYNDSLIAEADEAQTRPPEWDELVGEEDHMVGGGGRREMLFYGVMGQQVAVDPVVPSWCNPLEAVRCVELVEGLLQSAMASYRPSSGGPRQAPLMQEDVGVIAPFRKQVYEIRRQLRAVNLGGVRCGTVDDFQGQEARVMFISTTLSRVASLRDEEDPSKRGTAIGTLLSDVQRFCVAITRAQALLVVVGHPVLLLEANTWRNLILHCAARGAYKGAGASTLASRLGRGDSLAQGLENGLRITGDSQDDLESAVEQICQMAVLGSGDVDMLFPDMESAQALAAAYSEEIPWRVAL